MIEERKNEQRSEVEQAHFGIGHCGIHGTWGSGPVGGQHGPEPSQLIQDVLLGSGITVSNVTFNGVADPITAQEGTGSFTATGSNLNIPAGIILSSGLASSIPGPASGFQSDILVGDFFDQDLETIAAENINDAAVLEFDFVPNGDSVKFRYVFGSETLNSSVHITMPSGSS